MKNIIHFKKIGSTQNYAKKIARCSPSNTIIIAEKQTSGRGQFERGWSSSRGGLYFSIILKPKIVPDKIPLLTLKMASAIVSTLKKIVKKKHSVLTKPPNDVIVKCKTGYRKIAGILTESSVTGNKIDWVVVGIGVNINNKIPKELKKIAVSLKEITKKNGNVKKIFKEIVKKFVITNRIDFL
ncbi:MAG TPA: biotin--[acetyl-CoA-carboxylase] ligase [Elusimicrobia bacterium]|nr:biotin--[acetyl-CoA-carboxylase] ligase [Elusimicrobiota bacterium]